LVAALTENQKRKPQPPASAGTIERNTMKLQNPKFLVALLLGLGLQATARADDLFFPVGAGFSSGHVAVFNKMEDLYRAAGFRLHNDTLVPVGVTFSPYYEFNCGLGVGATLGPTAFFDVHQDNGGSGRFGSPMNRSDDKISYIIPIGSDVRYTFLRDCDVSPYVKLGVRYPIAGGDNLGSSQPGPYGGTGVELFRTRRIAFGIEFGYDASRVTVKGPTFGSGSSRVTYSGFTGSLFVIF
jgi:hypothetical protein